MTCALTSSPRRLRKLDGRGSNIQVAVYDRSTKPTSTATTWLPVPIRTRSTSGLSPNGSTLHGEVTYPPL